jgi:hypothetical protein
VLSRLHLRPLALLAGHDSWHLDDSDQRYQRQLPDLGELETQISAALRDFARGVFAGTDPSHQPCQDCGGIHQRACPWVARMHLILNADGVVVDRDVTYWPNGQWEKDIVFPEDVWEADPGGGDAHADPGAEHAAPGHDMAPYSGGPEAPVAAGGEETG